MPSNSWTSEGDSPGRPKVLCPHESVPVESPSPDFHSESALSPGVGSPGVGSPTFIPKVLCPQDSSRVDAEVLCPQESLSPGGPVPKCSVPSRAESALSPVELVKWIRPRAGSF